LEYGFATNKIEAEQGNAERQVNLGLMYNYGKGVARNAKEAVKWYRSAIC
jgi:uncharacterized protein